MCTHIIVQIKSYNIKITHPYYVTIQGLLNPTVTDRFDTTDYATRQIIVSSLQLISEDIILKELYPHNFFYLTNKYLKNVSNIY